MSDHELHAILAAPNNPLLTWNAPLSEEHARSLIDACPVPDGGRVVDLGCGWGELLLRIVEGAPGSTGDGVDSDPVAVARGQRLARGRGLDSHVAFHESSADGWTPTGYDLAVSIGAVHAWPGSTREALRALRTTVKPGGQVLFGDGFWTTPPTADALKGLGAEEDELVGSLDDLVRAAADAGFAPLRTTVADQREWDVFESNGRAGWGERWALDHPDHPLRDDARATAARHRAGYLGGYRGYLGFAYLVLGV
ncbi:SAM-dependent methyltransferase [Streptomyces sp. NBC_01716]|uniref:SAM-dependent methyltransferase n=1 Tax=Streptomyces sp. NBC_01716 TaxID=2975917 RepID=UPI002E3057DC|nr:class I SAM-dependent methyltransferase [Streptomyces sp. NBC_01716]